MKNIGKGKSPSVMSDIRYTSVKAGDYDEDEDMESVRVHTQKQLEKQNSHLDILEASIGRLGSLGMQISQEVGVQNRMLDELEIEVEKSQQQVDTLTKKTSDMLTMAGVKNLRCTIVVLALIALFLFLLIIYT